MESKIDSIPFEEQTSTESVIERYKNARVTLHYNYGGGYTDTGRVTFIDHHWVEIVKDNTERLLVPIVSLRLIKLQEPAVQATYDAQTLLRATAERNQISNE